MPVIQEKVKPTPIFVVLEAHREPQVKYFTKSISQKCISLYG